MNDFDRDNEWQREQRDRILAPQFYDKYALKGRYVFMDKGRLASIIQKRFAADTILQSRNGDAVAIEEKIVRWRKSGKPYKAFCLETDSCTVPGHESEGWMVYGKADYLLYCFQQADGSLICYLIDFIKLCEWFWPRVSTFNVFRMQETLNKSCGRVVDIADVEANVPTWRFHLYPPEPAEEAA